MRSSEKPSIVVISSPTLPSLLGSSVPDSLSDPVRCVSHFTHLWMAVAARIVRTGLPSFAPTLPSARNQSDDRGDIQGPLGSWSCHAGLNPACSSGESHNQVIRQARRSNAAYAGIIALTDGEHRCRRDIIAKTWS